MKSRQRLSVTQTQTLSLTTGLLASIKMLRTDAAGLTRYLEEHAAENPYLALERPVVVDWLPRWTGALGTGGDRPAEDIDEAPAPSLIAHLMAEVDRSVPRRAGAADCAWFWPRRWSLRAGWARHWRLGGRGEGERGRGDGGFAQIARD